MVGIANAGSTASTLESPEGRKEVSSPVPPLERSEFTCASPQERRKESFRFFPGTISWQVG
eukprot:scaffold23953_cov59-Phaeocystis_antarctica.AAC.4